MSNDSRLIGHNLTEEILPSVKCISHTKYPLGTLFAVWHGSRHSKSVDPKAIDVMYRGYGSRSSHLSGYLYESYPEYRDPQRTELKSTVVKRIIEEVVKLSIKANVQNSEFVSYEFQVDNASVAWREQLVRKRQNHIWTQTSRVADMEHFDATMMPTVRMMGGEEAVGIYQNTVETVREAYRQLVELGVPSEDIRLQPQVHTHRVYFGCNLRNLLNLVSDRTSWIAQATLWTPVVSEVVRVLRYTLGSWIDDLLKPPCIVEPVYSQPWNTDDPKYRVTDYALLSDDQARYEGRDPLPVSPIYLAMIDRPNPYQNKEFYDYMKSMYINIWPQNVLTAIDWDRRNPKSPGRYDVGYEGDYYE